MALDSELENPILAGGEGAEKVLETKMPGVILVLHRQNK